MKTVWFYAVISVALFCASLDSRADDCGLELVRGKTVERIRRQHALELGALVGSLKVGEVEVSRGRHEEYWVYEVYYSYQLTTFTGDRPVAIDVVGRDTYSDRCTLIEAGWKKVTPVTEERG
ncbi:MAG TPA: hypothetical protein VM598_07100 [Bdellovibrionota bacterium]|nr:hypothetical protein [Bdellovibrionota bacterium]